MRFSPEAEQAKQNFLGELDKQLHSLESTDKIEMIQCIDEHIRETAYELGVETVELELIEHILAKVGSVESVAAEALGETEPRIGKLEVLRKKLNQIKELKNNIAERSGVWQEKLAYTFGILHKKGVEVSQVLKQKFGEFKESNQDLKNNFTERSEVLQKKVAQTSGVLHKKLKNTSEHLQQKCSEKSDVFKEKCSEKSGVMQQKWAKAKELKKNLKGVKLSFFFFLCCVFVIGASFLPGGDSRVEMDDLLWYSSPELSYFVTKTSNGWQGVLHFWDSFFVPNWVMIVGLSFFNIFFYFLNNYKSIKTSLIFMLGATIYGIFHSSMITFALLLNGKIAFGTLLILFTSILMFFLLTLPIFKSFRILASFFKKELWEREEQTKKVSTTTLSNGTFLPG